MTRRYRMTRSPTQRTRSQISDGSSERREVSIQHMALVLEAADLTVQESAILIAMCNHTDTNGKTFAGEERLMREAKLRKTQFRTWRARLVERELIVSRRRGRQGGGRTTSDTYVNLAKLRSMRDPFFGARATDRPEDENPFSQVDSNGPENRTIDADTGGNGPAGRTINGPENRTTQGRSAGPITLTNPQGEHTHQGTVESASAVGVDEGTGVCVNDDSKPDPCETVTAVVDAAQIAATTTAVVAGIAPTARQRVTPVRRRQIEAVVGECLTVGHTHDAIVAECRPATNDRTTHPTECVVAALKSLLAVDPATLVTQVTPSGPSASGGLSDGPECEHGRTGICQACASDALAAAAQARMATAGGAR